MICIFVAYYLILIFYNLLWKVSSPNTSEYYIRNCISVLGKSPSWIEFDRTVMNSLELIFCYALYCFISFYESKNSILLRNMELFLCYSFALVFFNTFDINTSTIHLNLWLQKKYFSHTKWKHLLVIVMLALKMLFLKVCTKTIRGYGSGIGCFLSRLGWEIYMFHL